MPRRDPTVIDLSARCIETRGRGRTACDRLAVGAGGIYVANPVAQSPRIAYQEQWLIPAQEWVVHRFTFLPHVPEPSFHWYIDLDAITVDDRIWQVEDRFLDLVIEEGRGYRVLDLDELADGIEAGGITVAESLAALRALHQLCAALPELGYSGAALLERYVPDLPR